MPPHPDYHRKVHSLFSEALLASSCVTVDTRRAHREVSQFVARLAGKSPGFHVSTRGARNQRR